MSCTLCSSLLHSYISLAFPENTVIVAHPSKSGGPWWYGLLPLTGKKGFFPHTYVQDLEEGQSERFEAYPEDADGVL